MTVVWNDHSLNGYLVLVTWLKEAKYYSSTLVICWWYLNMLIHEICTRLSLLFRTASLQETASTEVL